MFSRRVTKRLYSSSLWVLALSLGTVTENTNHDTVSTKSAKLPLATDKMIVKLGLSTSDYKFMFLGQLFLTVFFWKR